MFSNTHLEYIWIDNDNNLRSKIKIIKNISIEINNIPIWTFDGSSTGQAIGTDSDIFIKPIRLYKNPFINYMSSYIVLCECLNKDMTPHITNYRNELVNTFDKYKDFETQFGIEQEYMIFERKNDYDKNELNKNLPYKWKEHFEPELGNCNKYYCSVGGDRAFGREISNLHLKLCIIAEIDICGTNLEVVASQLEYQIGICDALKVCDDLFVSRYILHRITEDYNCWINFEPKPYKGDNINGSGCHTNFSNINTRNPSIGLKSIYELCDKLENNHFELLKVSGDGNEERLTGHNETSNINEFTLGNGNRGCSIRINHSVINDGYGYAEYRIPSANVNPYLLINKMMKCWYE